MYQIILVLEVILKAKLNCCLIVCNPVLLIQLILLHTLYLINTTRQGDPVSAYLFILALEVLFAFIKSNKNIKGIEIFK